jgi:serine protease Do
VNAKLGEFQPQAGDGESSDTRDGAARNNAGRLGIGVEPLTAESKSQLGLAATTEGVLIGEVEPVGPAAQAGLQRGDVIEQVNQQPVRSVADVTSALARSGNRPALLLINRRGTTLFVTVTPRP